MTKRPFSYWIVMDSVCPVVTDDWNAISVPDVTEWAPTEVVVWIVENYNEYGEQIELLIKNMEKLKQLSKKKW